MNTPIEDIQSLIIKSLDGKISDTELNKLRCWMEESSLNIKTYADIKKSWLLSARNNVDIDTAFSNVNQVLKRQHTLFIRRIAASAAVALLVMVSGFVYFYKPFSTHIDDVVNVKPGENKAILVLSNNEQMVLNKDNDIKTPEFKNEDNVLVYNENNEDVKLNSINKLITPRGCEYSIILSDGSHVFINAESELSYPVNFGDGNRDVYLKGEAYFNVTTKEGQPFVVHTEDFTTTVLGTEFNMKCYSKKDIALTLVKGSVEFATVNGEKAILSPGQQAILSPGQQATLSEEHIEVNQVEPMFYTAWKDGFFVYRQASIDYIMQELSRWYDFTYSYDDASLASYLLTAKLRKFDAVDDVFSVLEKTGHIRFIRQGSKVTITK